jgi:DDE superfamily endonuclease
VWQAARLAGVVHHSRAHDFFARRRWSADRLGFALAEFVVARWVGPSEPICLAVDDTLFSRSGQKVFAAGWHFDSISPETGRQRLGFGNSFVCLGIVARLGRSGGRLVCLPVLFRLWRPGQNGRAARTRVELAHELIARFAARFEGRRIEVTGDAYYANRSLRLLPETVSACVRLRANAALSGLPPVRQPGPGRPRTKGQRIGSVRELAAAPDATWQRLQITYPSGEQRQLEAIVFDCLWYKVLGPRSVRVVIARDAPNPRRVMGVLCTDTSADAAEILRRYAQRWTIEVAFAEAKGQLGVGQTRNRVQAAVERSVPFGFLCRALVLIWYALHGDPDTDIARRRKHAPWYRQKTTPAFADMLHALRRELIKAEYRAASTHPRTRPKIDPPTATTQTLTA